MARLSPNYQPVPRRQSHSFLSIRQNCFHNWPTRPRVSYLPNEKSKPPGRFSIFREPSRDKKRNDEAKELIPFFLRFDQLVELDDVEFGVDPPDFIFKLGADSIGVELTTVNPAVFIKGGNRRREDFREWQ